MADRDVDIVIVSNDGVRAVVEVSGPHGKRRFSAPVHALDVVFTKDGLADYPEATSTEVENLTGV